MFETIDYSIGRAIDELYLCLMKVEDNRYEKQAMKIFYLIPIYRPPPFFDIRISDLNEQVKKELDDRWKHKHEINHILKTSVGKIFLNINQDYFLLSVKRLLKVRLVE